MFLDPSLLVRAENATFNVAADSSTMLQCYDIRHCRTLPSIIFACFSTVFLCTWTALHFDLPYPLLLGRVGWMVLALFTPEGWFINAFRDWIMGSELLRKILRNYPKCGWTETHAQFVGMGGFRLVDAKGKTFLDCVQDGTIDLPKVSKDEILARSKGDNIAKIITHLLLTQLEVTTLGHTLINFFIYFFWWHKPYGVALPIEVPFKERRPNTEGRDNKVESKEPGSSDGNDESQTTEIGERPTQSSPISDDDPGSRTSEKGIPVVTTSNDNKRPAAVADEALKSDVEASNDTPSTSPQLSWYTQLGIKTFSVSDEEKLSRLGRIVLSTIWFIIGGSFGAMHCLAWNSTFPTRAEQYTWRVSSLIVTVIGGTTLVYGSNYRKIDYFFNTKGMSESDLVILFTIAFIIYCCARVTLLVLALLQLRALPYAGYATPSWTIFYPHIG